MTKTCDEFFETYEATKFLVRQLECNMEIYCEGIMFKEDREHFMRVNLIMIRQCLNDFGVE